jgi:broad specificity phosphatase PhoE
MLSLVAVVRHGESEGNVANGAPDVEVPAAFWPRHAGTWRLTDRGLQQARALGATLLASRFFPFTFHCVSPMTRALETAVHLGLPEARWRFEPALAERAWGPELRVLDAQQRARWLDAARAELDADPWGWAPPGGENLAGVQARVRALLYSLGAECPGGSALLVTHGEVISTLRAHLEGVADGGLPPGPTPTGVLLYRWRDNGWWSAELDPADAAVGWRPLCPAKDAEMLDGEVRRHERHVR